MKAKSQLTNQLLVAMPSIRDSFFEKSVIYVGQHDKDGAVGIALNKLTDLTLGNLFDKLTIEATHQQNTPLHMGGPENSTNVFILNKDRRNEDLIEVSGSEEGLKKIARGEGPDPLVVILGYVMWESGELEEEIATDWLIAPASPLILEVPPNRRWETAAAFAGVNVRYLSSQVGHA